MSTESKIHNCFLSSTETLDPNTSIFIPEGNSNNLPPNGGVTVAVILAMTYFTKTLMQSLREFREHHKMIDPM